MKPNDFQSCVKKVASTHSKLQTCDDPKNSMTPKPKAKGNAKGFQRTASTQRCVGKLRKFSRELEGSGFPPLPTQLFRKLISGLEEMVQYFLFSGIKTPTISRKPQSIVCRLLYDPPEENGLGIPT